MLPYRRDWASVIVCLVLYACVGDKAGAVRGTPGDSASSAADDSAPDSDSDADSANDSSGGSANTFSLVAPDVVALPYVTVGRAVPAGTLSLTTTGPGSTGAVTVTVDGPFTVTLDTAPFSAEEPRTGTVGYTGADDEPIIAIGHVALTVDDQSVTIELVAVVGDPAIGSADWVSDDWGRCTTLELPTAPFPYGGAAYDDSSVRICVPTGLSDRGNLAQIVHFHGFGATIDEVDAYQHLHAQAAISGRDAVFVLPQGPVEASDGDFGRLDEPEGLANLLRDVRAVLYREGVVTRPDAGPLTVTSHSGGYNVTANVIEVGGEPVAAVHLFDSIYARSDTFEAYAEAGGVMRSSYTDGGGTDDDNRALAASLRADGVDIRDDFHEDTLRASPVTIGFMDSAHGDCLHWDLSYARWLAASGLPHAPGAAPELLYARSDGADARVGWRAEAGESVVIEGSNDGSTWEDLATSHDDHATVPARPYVRLRTEVTGYDRSAPSDTFGATGRDWLIVDGFDRIFGGSWTSPTNSFPALLGGSLPAAFSVASNEAVAEGDVDLSDYARVLWLLGDESLEDRTFDDREQAAVDAYIAGGGALVVSGSEVGYASGDWLRTSLHARYVADDAGTNEVEGWTMGVTYPEDYPDVLDGDEVLWRYGNGQAAAVGWDGRVVVVGFALETLGAADRTAALGALQAWLDGG